MEYKISEEQLSQIDQRQQTRKQEVNAAVLRLRAKNRVLDGFDGQKLNRFLAVLSLRDQRNRKEVH